MALHFLVLLAALLVLPAAAAQAESAEAVRDCVEANFPERSSLQHIELHSIDRAGGTRELEARVHWKRFDNHPRAMIRVDAPNDVKGAAYLMIQAEGEDPEQVYVYMPAMKKVRRITTTTASNQLWGTDFSYEDMKLLQGAAKNGTVALVGGGEIAGRATHVLETRLTAAAESSYERVVSHVDTESCVALRTDFFERGESPRKVLDADPGSLIRDGSRWMATRFQMIDQKNQTRTELVVVRSEMDAKLPDRLFSPSRLGKSR